jgi:flagellar biosynthetic protein FlhB
LSGGDKSQKTEKATPKKIKDARKQGQVAKSPEVSAWVTTFGMTLLLPWTGERAVGLMRDLTSKMAALIAEPDQARAIALWADGMRGALMVVMPMAVALMLLGVGSNLAQVGFTPSTKALKPQMKRLNPMPGLKRMVGPKTAWQATKELIKLGLLAVLAYKAVKAFVPVATDGGGVPLMVIVGSTGHAAISFLRSAALLGLILAGADYGVQRWQHAKDLRMSKQEIKDEYKQADGDPHVKGRIRERQMAMSRNRMMADVGTADVVLVNPTHVAVALKYDPLRGAPTVVAKGQGNIAAKIREKADEHRVPMIRDVPLARAVYAACEIGDPVPPDLYGAVAKVLAFVFSLRRKGSAAGTHVVPPPALTSGR